MKYAFHPEAEAEFLDAIGYYEECEPGLAPLFASRALLKRPTLV